MKVFVYKPILECMTKWRKTEEGWCEWSLESKEIHINTEKNFFNKQNIPFKLHKAKRKDLYGKKLRWELLTSNSIDFLFIMLAYVPNPRPQNIKHPNGITGVSKLIVGKEKLDVGLLSQLLPN